MYLKDNIKSNCCGCKACEAVCPTKAIEFCDDVEGFWYPEINNDICINCKKCEKVCSFNADIINNEYLCYGGWNKSSKLRDNSSSGGVFIALAKYVIENNGVVFGAAYGADFSVKHILVDNIDDLQNFQKSKYVQSDTKGTFELVAKNLNRGIKVLFSGTPCQVSALVSFLGQKNENLILCEVLCFGVPSPKVYKKYLEYNEKIFKSKITSINFKDKRYGWDYYTTEIKFSNGKSTCQFGGDSYKKLMHKGLSIRPSCFNCRFDVNSSCADITLGDFYNFSKYTKKTPPKNGVSCIVVRTKQGEFIFEQIANDLTLYKLDYNLFSMQEKKAKKTFDNVSREEFFEFINADEYEKYINRFKNNNFIELIKIKLFALRKKILGNKNG